MKSFRVLALSILAFIFVITLAACGGGGRHPNRPRLLSPSLVRLLHLAASTLLRLLSTGFRRHRNLHLDHYQRHIACQALVQWCPR